MKMHTLPKLLLMTAFVLQCLNLTQGDMEGFFNLVTNFTVQMVKTQQTVLFGCSHEALLTTSAALLQANQPTQAVDIRKNYTLTMILTRWNHAKTTIVLDCNCTRSSEVLQQVSLHHYFNKTYQWLLFDGANTGFANFFPAELDYLGPNAQVTYVNGSVGSYMLWDLHSKGLHLRSSLEVTLIAEWKTLPGRNISGGYFVQHIDIFQQQGIRERSQFNGLALRGACVIDQNNITTNEQIVSILSHSTKDTGVATFIKYHYNLLLLLSDRLNFTVNFRNSRGWAGRLGNTTFRLGLLGVLARNEVDVAASGAFTRINRFAEFDTIHQSWKFEAGFLYRFTPDLDTQGKSGNFLAPFDDRVWCYAIAILFVFNFLWRLVEWLKSRWRLNDQFYHMSESAATVATAEDAAQDHVDNNDAADETSLAAVSLKTFAAVCQQGMEPMPSGLPTRTIVLTIFVFSLVMYNFYTSSVVGGLLSSTAQGPATIADVIASPLKLSFEDIGYYKVMFREAKTPLIVKLHKLKVLPKREFGDLPVYIRVEDAIPYLKKGGYAFHCEVIDAYPGIAKQFDVDDICDLRMVSGLLEVEIFNWYVPKRSQYTEIFRIIMSQAREVGLVKRTLEVWQAKKPLCQALYRVFPINLSGVLSAFLMLLGGYIAAVAAVIIERYKWRKTAAKIQTNSN